MWPEDIRISFHEKTSISRKFRPHFNLWINSELKASVVLLQVFVCVLVCAAYASAGFLGGGGGGGYSGGGGGGGWQSGEQFIEFFFPIPKSFRQYRKGHIDETNKSKLFEKNQVMEISSPFENQQFFFPLQNDIENGFEREILYNFYSSERELK